MLLCGRRAVSLATDLERESTLAALISSVIAHPARRLAWRLAYRFGSGVFDPAAARIGGFGALCRVQRQLVWHRDRAHRRQRAGTYPLQGKLPPARQQRA